MNDFLAFDLLKPAQVGTVDQQLEEVILESNKTAMEHLKTENFGLALELLKKAEGILSAEYKANPNQKTYRLIGITLNNLGCYYKRHDEALKHVKLAVELLEMAKGEAEAETLGIEGEAEPTAEEENKFENEKREKIRTIITTTIIAHYNYGTELEYLKEYQKSVQAFSKGYHIALKELGPNNQLTQTLYDNMLNLGEKNKVIENSLQKKSENLLKNLEANRYIRYRPGYIAPQTIMDRSEKTIEYSMDGHRKFKVRRGAASVSPSMRQYGTISTNNSNRSNYKPVLPRKLEPINHPLRPPALKYHDLNTVNEVNESNPDHYLSPHGQMHIDHSFAPEKSDRRLEIAEYDVTPGGHNYSYIESSIPQSSTNSKAALYSLDNELNDLDAKINQTINDISKYSQIENNQMHQLKLMDRSTRPPIGSKPMPTNFTRGLKSRNSAKNSMGVQSNNSFNNRESQRETDEPGITKSEVSYGKLHPLKDMREQGRSLRSRSNPRPAKGGDYLKVQDVFSDFHSEHQHQDLDRLINRQQSQRASDMHNSHRKSQKEIAPQEPYVSIEKHFKENKKGQIEIDSPIQMNSHVSQNPEPKKPEVPVHNIPDKAKVQSYLKYFD